jgi:LmbE family N-acetylglucosaminyl deacetylase
MTFLFVFAHPDDETVACAGTIYKLIQSGHEVVVVSVTNGSAGQATQAVQKALASKYRGDLGALREAEFTKVCTYLGVHQVKLLQFTDGQITNEEVWGKLTTDIIALIDQHQSEVVITFDHSGWYYHLDHVGVSIATTLAFHQTKSPQLLLFSNFQPQQNRWQYVFPDPTLSTHQVVVEDFEHKLKALQIHESQDLEVVKQHILSQSPHVENYQLAFFKDNTNDLIEKIRTIFQVISK